MKKKLYLYDRNIPKKKLRITTKHFPFCAPLTLSPQYNNQCSIFIFLFRKRESAVLNELYGTLLETAAKLSHVVCEKKTKC